MGTALLTALALLLIFEGIGPFLWPDRFRRLMQQVSELPDSQLRLVGAISMSVGLILLYIFH